MNGKRFSLLVAAATAAGFLGGSIASWLVGGRPVFAEGEPGIQGTVRAESFQIVDKEGNARAELSLAPDGNPALVLIDRDYRVRAVFGLTDDGRPTIDLRDGSRLTRFRVQLLRNGSPFLRMTDSTGGVRARFGVLCDDGPCLRFWDDNSRLAWTAPE